MKAFNRVILNTGVLYSSLIVKLIVGLFSTRLILAALGETDYGIYMLVAGVVGMLGILNTNMANTSMRYMSVSLGTGDQKTIRKTFNTTLYIHLIIGAIVIVLMEIGGWIFFNYLLNIPDNKIFDAKIVFQFMIITTFITVISVPYDAVINSHEHIWALSVIDVFGALLKLLLAFYLTYKDKNLLILYGLFMMIIQIILRIVKQRYSKNKFEECNIRFKQYVDKDLIKSILSFTGWNLFGSIAGVAAIQIRSILINMFFGVRINAAEGIAKSACSQVNNVAVSMTQAINPQLMKSEGENNRQKLIYITELSTKYSAFLFALFGIPVLFEAHYLLSVWLKEVPDFAVIFCQLTMITMLLEKFTFQITHAIRAVGNIRNFQITETIVCCLYIPVVYFLFKKGFGPSTIYVIGIFTSLMIIPERLYFGKKVADIRAKDFFIKAISPLLTPLIIGTGLILIPRLFMPEGFFRLAVVSLTFGVVLFVLFWAIGMQTKERVLFINLLKGINKKHYGKKSN